MKNLILSSFFLLLLPLLSQAQAPGELPGASNTLGCASTEMMLSRQGLWLKQQQLEDFMLANPALVAAGKPAPFVLPLVVHIIHQNGTENISDAQVFAAVEHLNQAFAHEGYYAQQGDGANTQIQFCLARRTPDGQLSNGITRTASALTNMIMETEDQALKDLSRWDPKDYVNIWVVNGINSQSFGPGVAGYAYLASAHGEPYDGIVCEARYFGSNPSEDAVLIHEIGHYLNLYHTFEGGCTNSDCISNGDRVCDTPPDQATHTNCLYNSCHTDADDNASNNPFTTDVDDMTENFMDYSPFPCYHAFTAGQGTRMHIAIEQFRSSLLNSMGCLNPCALPITAAFTADNPDITAGETVNFTNLSTGASHFEWYVNGNLESTATDFSFQFLGVGNFEVQLKAFNADPNCVAISVENVAVKCAAVADFALSAIELTAGETLVCTNNSSGASAYTWFINGVDAGSMPNFSYTFNNPGYYTIILQATNGFCNSEHSNAILVYSNSPCKDEVLGRHYDFSGTPGYVYHITPAFHPDGGLYAYSYVPPRGLAVRFDAQGNKLWQNAVNVTYNGIEDICVLDDGSAIFANDNAHTVFKLDENGALAWSKSVEFPSGTVEFNSINLGDGALFYAVNGATNLFLLKFLTDGTLAWAHQYHFDAELSIMWDKTAVNDSGFWLPGLTQNPPMYEPDGGVILRFDHSGNLLFSKRYRFETDNNVSLYAVTVNDNNEFVACGADQMGLDIDNVRQFIFKADAAGNPIWGKKFVPTADELYARIQNVKARPNGGYLHMIDFGMTSRKWAAWSETGTLEFIEELTSPGYMDDIILKDGQMTGFIKKEHSGKDFYLLNLGPDGKPPLCSDLKITTRGNFGINMVAQDFPYSKINYTPVITPKTLTTGPYPLAFDQLPFCIKPSPCVEFCDNGQDDDEDGYVDCFDSDCDCYAVDTACTLTLQPNANGFSAKMAWECPQDFVAQTSTPFVGNLNPWVDSIPEILLQSENLGELIIFRGDGLNKANPVRFSPPLMSYLVDSPPVLADINTDGIPELILPLATGKIAVYTNYQETQTPPFTFWFESSPTVTGDLSILGAADFDFDGTPELYVGNQIFAFDFTNPAAPTLSRKLKGTGHAGARHPLAPGFFDASAAADMLTKTDCNGDPDCDGLELVAGAHIYSVDLDLSDGDGLEIKIQRNLNLIEPGQSFADGFTQVADINLDGTPDVIVNAPNNTKKGLYVWDKNGLISLFPYLPANIQYSLGKLTISNVFDDKKAGFATDLPEIIGKLGDPKQIVAFNLNAQSANPAQPYWWAAPTDDESNLCFVSAFDFNRDGLDELVSKGDTFLRVYYGGAAPFPPGVNPNSRIWYQLAHKAGTAFEGAIIADIDADQEAEILYTWNSGGLSNRDGRLRVLKSANIPWPNARPIWNQFNYHGLNVNDDLSIPKTQQKHWLEMGGIGSGNRPFNKHLAQTGTLNPAAPNAIKVPDASIALNATLCQTDSFELQFNLCNLGSADLPIGTPMAFYNGDPTTSAAPLLFPPIVLAAGIQPGDCAAIKLRIPAIYNTSIFVVINDDGSVARPFNLSTQFPSTDQYECQYSNNITSFSIQNQNLTLDLGPDLSICQNAVFELKANPAFQKFRWQDGSVLPNFTAFAPGKYWVDAYDACGFKQTDTVQILLNTQKTLNLPDTLSYCKGDQLPLTVSGFASYIWAPADSLDCSDCASVQLLASQSFTLFLTASDGDCFAADSVRVEVSPKPGVQLLVQNGDCNTSASLTANVGPGTFDIQWSNGLSGNVISPSIAGTYAVSVTNDAGCTVVDSAEILVADPNFGVVLQISAIPCSGGTGMVIANGFGGTGQYDFAWSTGDSTQSISVLLPGWYSLTLTDRDGAGCMAIDSVEVEANGSIALEASSAQISCFGAKDGEAQAFPLEGTAPFSWLWSTGQTSASISGLAAGIYSVTVSDALACTGMVSLEIIEPGWILVAAQALDFKLCPNETTTINTMVAGGTPPYTFLWSNGLTDSILTGVSVGNYMLTVTDQNHCIGISVVEIEAVPMMVLLLDSVDHASGPMQADGSIFVQTTGGVSPFGFLWSNGATTKNLLGVLPGTYSLTVTDAAGCTQTLSAVVDYVLSSGEQWAVAMGWNAQIRPNPSQATDAAQLVIESEQVQIFEIHLFDAIGRVLWEGKMESKAGEIQVQIPTPAAAGIYWVRVSNGQELKSLKWVVMD